ncbi:hypothetical protein D6C94_04495 [Aureobasidium pullulans]|uniref:Syntaxin-5 N-terminal Sly1p-binding domain-containing protein n=1 Tax=Aureobasidium pullulans TaxID=5580 RepID=A0AB38M204_AURPU|nr:hypothetical protein D6C94_04495 [Aureobasidium pullulans]
MELLPSYIYIHHPSQTPFTIFNSQRSSTTILHNHLETAAKPDQTIKEHFDTIATALDAATAKATGYSKTLTRDTAPRRRSSELRTQTLRTQNDRLTEIIVKNANIPKKMQEEIDDLNFRLAGLPFCLSIRDKFRDKLSELDDLDEQYRTSQSAKHFESMHGPRRIVRPEEKDTAISHDN